MKKKYVAPEMEILDAEIEGFLAASGLEKENGYVGTQYNQALGHGQDGDFESEDDYEYEY